MTGVFDLAPILIRVECRKGKLFLPGTARYGCNTRRFLRNPATNKKRLSNSTYFLYRDLLGGTSAATHLFPKAQVNTRYCSQEKCHYAYIDDFFFSQAVILINCWTCEILHPVCFTGACQTELLWPQFVLCFLNEKVEKWKSGKGERWEETRQRGSGGSGIKWGGSGQRGIAFRDPVATRHV